MTKALPLAVSFVAAALLAPGLLRVLSAGRLEQDNYRGVRLPFPAGTAIVAAAALALGPLALLAELAGVDLFADSLGMVAVYTFGVAFLGLLDDGLAAQPRGWRGHGAAVLELTLATNLFNLLDLRPGRSFKCFVVLGAALTVGAWDLDSLWALGLFVGPVLVLGAYDVRERAMLGDTGSNLIGGLAGLWLVLTLDTTGLAIALGLLLAVTIYGEFRSISALIERTPLLRQLDSIGRPA